MTSACSYLVAASNHFAVIERDVRQRCFEARGEVAMACTSLPEMRISCRIERRSSVPSDPVAGGVVLVSVPRKFPRAVSMAPRIANLVKRINATAPRGPDSALDRVAQ